MAALILSFAVVPLLELLRSGTTAMEIPDVEIAARTLAADVLERFAASSSVKDRLGSRRLNGLLGREVPWDELLDADPILAAGMPRAALTPMLEQAATRVKIQLGKRHLHPSLDPAAVLFEDRVSVTWTDAADRRREVTLARFFR